MSFCLLHCRNILCQNKPTYKQRATSAFLYHMRTHQYSTDATQPTRSSIPCLIIKTVCFESIFTCWEASRLSLQTTIIETEPCGKVYLRGQKEELYFLVQHSILKKRNHAYSSVDSIHEHIKFIHCTERALDIFSHCQCKADCGVRALSTWRHQPACWQTHFVTESSIRTLATHSIKTAGRRNPHELVSTHM